MVLCVFSLFSRENESKKNFLLYSSRGIDFDNESYRIYDASLFALLARNLVLFVILLLSPFHGLGFSTFNILIIYVSFTVSCSAHRRSRINRG